MTFLSNYQSKQKTKKSFNTTPSKAEVDKAKKMGIDLAKSWRPYAREARLHIYVSDMKEMVRFYNQVLELPVVRYWRYSDGDGTMLNIGGNIIELFSKGRRNYSNKNYYGNVSVSIKVNDVNKLHDKFSKKNIQISVLEENPWGDKSFSLIDPEENRLVFFSPTISKEKYYKVKSS